MQAKYIIPVLSQKPVQEGVVTSSIPSYRSIVVKVLPNIVPAQLYIPKMIPLVKQ